MKEEKKLVVNCKNVCVLDDIYKCCVSLLYIYLLLYYRKLYSENKLSDSPENKRVM